MVKVETITRGVYGAISIQDSLMFIESFDERTQEIDLSPRATLLGSYLLMSPNCPVNAYRIKRSEDFQDLDVAKAFKDIAAASKGTMLESHWLAIGRSSSTWYGFLDEDSDDNKLTFADTGIEIIESERTLFGDKRTEKRLRPFHAYKSLVQNGEEEKFFSRDRKIAGAGAIVLSIGAVSTIYLTRHFKNH